MIPYGRQDITQDDVDAVVNVLRSDFLTQGPQVPRFEKKIAEYCNVKYAVAVNSATSALHIACLALDLGPDDCLWTSPITFVASANCALYCGAQVDFVDINPFTFNLCPVALEEKLKKAELQSRLPKIVVAVHMCGQPSDMQAIYGLAKKYGFRLIEDASHAIGGSYQTEKIGNCRYSDVTIFSFHPVKIITTAEGGVAVTNDAGLAERMALYRSHGITRDPTQMSKVPDGTWYYEQIALGFNYRMTELQAALGVSQLDRLDAYVTRRHEIARRYDQLLSDMPLQLPQQQPASYSAFHLYIIRLNLSAISKSHSQVFNSLREQEIGVNLHYIPVHMQPYYRRLGFNQGDFPEAEKYYGEAISLPMYSSLTDVQQDRVVSALKIALFGESVHCGN